MATPRILILRAPGTNCDVETAHAFEMAGGEAVAIHVQQLIERPILADNFQVLCFPGGFSYGDDIAAGRVLATQLNVHLSEVVESFRSEDRLVLGICNGFQIMMRLGIFFDSAKSKSPATLTWNNQGRFETRWVHLKADSESPFLKGIDQMYLPMAHAEGRFVTVNAETTEQLKSQGQVAIRYSDEQGKTGDEILPFPINPNGAELNLAGLTDESGNVFGLMPHPERHLFATHHPFWTRRPSQPEHGDGLAIFKNAVAFFS
jgi:phosphoribosylformylglycinamidine synthase subunit PurQ / glutaminase